MVKYGSPSHMCCIFRLLESGVGYGINPLQCQCYHYASRPLIWNWQVDGLLSNYNKDIPLEDS